MKAGRERPNYLVSSTEGHHQQAHQSISHGQGGDEIVGGAVQSSLLVGGHNFEMIGQKPTTDIVHLII